MNKKILMIASVALAIVLFAVTLPAYADETEENEVRELYLIKLAPPKIAKPSTPEYKVVRPITAGEDDLNPAQEGEIKPGKLDYRTIKEIAALTPDDPIPDRLITTTTKPDSNEMISERYEEDGDYNIPREGEYWSLGVFKVTHYCPCEVCSGHYGTSTASGEQCRPGIIAADLSVLPMHMVVYLGEEKTEYVVKDVGGGVKGKHIDVFVPTHDEVNAKGRYYAELFVR